MPDKIVIQLSATGSEAIARLFEDLAKKSQTFASTLAAGAKQIDGALGGTTSTLREFSGLMGQAGISTGVLGQALGALTSPLGLAAAGFVGLALGVKQATAAMLENYKEVRQLQAVTGLSAEAADNLADTFKMLGVETSALSAAMFKMSSEIEAGGETLRLLGLNVRDAAGNLKVEGDVFLEIRDRLSAIGSAAERNALGIQIFGRQFRELAPIFALSRSEFIKFQTEASKLSGWTEESQKAAAAYAVAINKLGLAWGDFWNQAGVAIAGPGAEILRWFTDAIQTAKEYGRALQSLMAAGSLADFLAPSPEGGAPHGGDPTGGLAAVPAISLNAQKALREFKKQLDVMRASDLDQPIVKLNQAFQSFADKEGPAAAAAMRPLVDQMIGLTRGAQAAPAQLEAMKRSIDDVQTALGEAGLLLDLHDVSLALRDLSLELGQTADQVKKDADVWRDEQAALAATADALKQLASINEALNRSFTGGAAFTAELIAANRELSALKATTDLDAASIRQFGVSFALLDADMQRALTDLVAWNTEIAATASATAYAGTLRAIGIEASLVGDRLDVTAATISAMDQRLKELARTSNGVVTPAMRELAAQLEELRQFQDLRDMFQDIFSSVGSAINTLVQGVILGTQTMAEAFKKLGQSIVVEFVNRVIQQALNPLVKAAATAVATLFAPAGARAATGGIGGGASGDAGAPEWALPGGGNLPTGIFDVGTLSNLWTGATNAWGAFNASLESGGSALEAFSGAWDSFAVPFQGAASGLSVALAGVGAAVAVFGTIMDFVNGKTEAAIGGVTGAAIGAVGGGLIGAAFGGIGAPAGALIGGALGDFIGSWLGGMFGGPSQYQLTRIKAADEANAALGSVAGGYQSALNTGNIAQILAALSTGAGGSGNAVRTELVLPSGLAGQIGITGQQIGDQLVAQWSSLTLEQFQQVIAAFKEQPDLITSIRGSGDVPYLPGGEAEGVANQIAQGAQALLAAFIDMETVRDKIADLATDLGDMGADILPPDVADHFAHGIVDPIRDRMLAVLSSGLPVAEMQKQLDALAAELQTYVGMVALEGQATQEMAALSRDRATQQKAALLGIKNMLDAADRVVEDAQQRAATATGPGEALAAEAQLHDAIMKRYAMEVQAVREVEAEIAKLATAQSQVTANLIGAAVGDLARGNADAFNDLYLSLADLAMTAPTVVERLAAIGQGLAAVLAAAPTTAGFLAGGTSDQIVDQLQQNVAPFFGALGDLIKEAAEAGDLEGQLGLLQQQAELIKQVGAAEVQAVQAWADAAIKAATEAAEAQRELINTIADYEISIREKQLESLQKALELAQKWQSVLQASVDLRTRMERSLMTPAERAASTGAAFQAAQDAINVRVLPKRPMPGVPVGPEGSLLPITPAQLDALRTAADAYLTDALANIREIADAQIAGVEQVRDASVAALNDQIQATQQAGAAAVATAREWEGIVTSTGDFLMSLTLGSGAPINPADQLALAQSTFDAAQAAFGSAPTASNAGAVQAAAQALLAAGQGVFSRPSPEYQALFASVVTAMEGVQAKAVAMAPVSSADLERQTAEQVQLLQGQIDAVNAASKAQIDAINAKAAIDAAEVTKAVIEILKAAEARAPTVTPEQIETEITAIQAQLAWWKDWRTEQLANVAAALDTQVTAIKDAAKATIDGINAGVAAALTANAAAQNAILGPLMAAQQARLDALPTIAESTAAAVTALGAIKTSLDAFLARTTPSAASTKGVGGVTLNYAPSITVQGGGDPVRIKAMIAEALRKDRQDLLRELETGAAGRRLAALKS